MESQEDEQIVQVREALMCPKGKRFEGLRTARFLKHTTMSIDDDVFDLPLDAFISRPESIDPEKWTAKISFPCWASPSPDWAEWVNAMAEKHAAVWRKAGVHDAILASRYEIKKRDELLMALVEKWCIETNTFVFPWGEATLTLEDMVVLGGFSVIGNNAMAPVKREEMKEVEERMRKVKSEIEVGLGKKCCSVGLWMKEMMNGSEIEHEGFLVTWLSRFVFPNVGDLVKEMLFPAAVQLAKGVTLALAPAVLAGVYRDLGVLKEHLAGFGDKETVVVKSPLYFVLVWAYERIMELQPPGQPGQLKPGEPRMARWHQHGVGGGQDLYGYPENVRAVLDSSKESFEFRPYAKPLSNFKFPRFYLEDNCWVHLHSDDKNVVAFGRCLRFCKLVGVQCIEPYYPHRVALQFGYDQDVPGVVSARNETPELAWKDYIRPIAGDMIYIPARGNDGDVTVRYIRWWKLSFAMLQAEAKKLSHKLLASPPRQKPTAAVTKTKKGSSVTGSMILGRSLSNSSSAGSLIGSEKGDKVPLKRPEWVQRSPPGSKKSPDRSSSSALGGGAKDLKGVLRGLGRSKGQGHVTFQLPSPKRSPPSKINTPLEKQNDSSVKKPRMVPRVAELAKRPSSSSQVQRNSSVVPLPHRRDNYTKNNDCSSQRGSKEAYKAPSLSGYPSKRNKSPSVSGSRESPKSPSVSGSSSLTRKKLPGNNKVANVNKSSSSYLGSLSFTRKNKSPRSSETVSLSGNSSFGGSSATKRSTDITSKGESPRKAQEQNISKATNVKFLEEIVTLREHVGEEGEVTYHIPKQQFEDLSQGVQDVLHDLHSIKSALNIQDDDD